MKELRAPLKAFYIQSIASLQKSYGETRMAIQGGYTHHGKTAKYHNPGEGNTLLRDLLNGSKPLMIARYGLYELRVVGGYLMENNELVNQAFFNLCNNAGFFPYEESLVSRFVETYTEATKKIDCFAAWNYRHGLWKEEQRVFQFGDEQTKLIDIDALNFYKYENPWTSSLEGKRVLVVHPFTTTIKNQYQKRSDLFTNQRTLPEFKSLDLVTAIQSAAGSPTQFRDWFAALNYMKGEIEQKDFDVALIGAGAYGLPLAAFVKSLGKKAVHMGGVSQMLFGIRGKRWEKNYSHFFNEHWVRPGENETPRDAQKVEGGCYW